MNGEKMHFRWKDYMNPLLNESKSRRVLYEGIAEWFPHDLLTQRYHHIRRLEVVLSFLKQVGNDFPVLDTGCGGGIQAERVALSNRVIGIDISLKRIKKASQRVKEARFVCGDANFLPFKSDRFDVLLLLELIEHLEFPKGVLNEASRVLKGPGYLILTLSCRTNILDFFSGLWGGSNWGLTIDKSHTAFYSLTSIRDLLKNSGFDMVKHRGGPCLNWNITFLNKTIFRRHKIYRFADRLASFIPLIRKYGATEIIWAKKCAA